jgi:hypothetical protein
MAAQDQGLIDWCIVQARLMTIIGSEVAGGSFEGLPARKATLTRWSRPTDQPTSTDNKMNSPTIQSQSIRTMHIGSFVARDIRNKTIQDMKVWSWCMAVLEAVLTIVKAWPPCRRIVCPSWPNLVPMLKGGVMIDNLSVFSMREILVGRHSRSGLLPYHPLMPEETASAAVVRANAEGLWGEWWLSLFHLDF